MSVPFSHPLLLALLLVPAWLMLRTWRRSTARLVLPYDHAGRRSGHWLAAMVSAAESLPAVLLAIVILILAGPQRQSAPQTRRVMSNIEFCVDISGSMSESFHSGTRYDAAMSAINKFLDFRAGDAFGLTFFGNNVLHWAPLTTDPSAVKCALPFMRPEKVPYWFGGTEIGKALLACGRLLAEREEGDRMIILVSDGWSADLNGDRPAEVAAQLKGQNIVVHAVHISDTPVPDEIVNLTAWTGGEVFSPEDPQTLDQVFARIDALQKTRVELQTPETIDHYRPYCLAGVSLAGLCVACLWGLRYTPW